MSYPQLLTPEEKLAEGKASLDIPPIVVICGSTRFMAEMAEADLHETAAGKIVVKPGCNMKQPHALWADPVEAEALKVRLDGLHRAKIRLADEVLVVGDYIGDSTRAEIAYARELGKPVRFTHPEVDPDVTSTSACGICKGAVGWIDCPTGGWWAHAEHPADGHDAQPVAANCPAALLPLNAEPVERCVVRGGHYRHRSALGETWTNEA
jgi:hypothetical protein